VLDLFCGIGPFAIPLAKKRCHVFANDLNPVSYQYLTQNVKLNRISSEFIKCYNKDAREYIREYKGEIHHVLMNLPASAVEFLDMFQGLYSKDSVVRSAPTVHCYHFADHSNPERETVRAVEIKLDCKLVQYSTHLVRKISPTKIMVCISFTVPRQVLEGRVNTSALERSVEEPTSALEGEEPLTKKQKMGDGECSDINS